jgi:serine/threonine-protein kinase
MNHYQQYVGQILDKKYRIDAVLGVGGMSAVLAAQDLESGQRVAVKMLKEEISDDKQAVRQFITESKAVAMLNHPGIVKIHDVVIRDEIKYIVMGYIEGETLRSYMDSVGVLPLNKTIDIILQILDALEHAHKKGVVHRDIKPQNIIMLKNGKVVVTDFGIAKIASSENTVDDKTIGTVYYISPEQAEGGTIDHRSDLYSLGAMLFEMITGRLPFNADSTIAIAMKQINEQPPSPRDVLPTIPIGMEQIVQYALAKSPDERFQSAAQMKTYLEALKKDPFAVFSVAPKDQYRIMLEEEDKELKRKRKEEERRKEQEEEERKTPMVHRIKGDSWSPIPMMLGIIVAFVLVSVVGGFYAIKNVFWDSSLNVFVDRTGEDVVIGDYVGKEFTQADKTYLKETLGYKSVVMTYEYSETVAQGKVISQEPRAGRVKKLNSAELKVVISLGSNVVESTFPDYSMEDYRTVRLVLLDKGYEVEMVPIESSAVDSCLILRTDPAAGSKITEGMKVTVYYSAGPKASEITYEFPNFEGMTVNEVRNRIELSGLNLVEVRYEFSDTVEKGRIISSSIPAGRKPLLTPLRLVISKGVDPSTLPPDPGVLPEDDLI